MIVETEKHGGTCRVRIEGELTIYQAPALRQALQGMADDRCGSMAFDLSHVTEMDTAGLQLLLVFRREVSSRNKSMRIEAATPAVRDLLRLVNVAECFGLPHTPATPLNAG